MDKVKRIFVIMCAALLMLGGCGAGSVNSLPEKSGSEPLSELSIEQQPTPSTAKGELDVQPQAPPQPELTMAETEEEPMKISVSSGDAMVVFELNDSPASQALIAQLPLEISVEDYSTNEKIFYPPEKLDITGTPLAGGKIGTLAYYAPWGDVVMFYGAFGKNGSLYELGTAASGEDFIQRLSGIITIENVEEPTSADAKTAPANPNQNNRKVLVAYFSCTGATKAVAETAAEILGADLYEIAPEKPYTADDLNYGNNNSRTSLEQNNPTARPAIASGVENLVEYDVVLLGYPIWWGEAPKIISTFLESGDFSGKTIVPFCTSGGSGVGASATNLHALSPNATWLDGVRFGRASQNDVQVWLNGTDIAGENP